MVDIEDLCPVTWTINHEAINRAVINGDKYAVDDDYVVKSIDDEVIKKVEIICTTKK